MSYYAIDCLYEIASAEFSYPMGWKKALSVYLIGADRQLYKKTKEGHRLVKPAHEGKKTVSYQVLICGQRITLKFRKDIVANYINNLLGGVTLTSSYIVKPRSQEPAPVKKQKENYGFVIIDSTDDTPIETRYKYASKDAALKGAKEFIWEEGMAADDIVIVVFTVDGLYSSTVELKQIDN